MSRIERINQQIKREVGDMLEKEIQDPRVRFVTITGVEVSRDLQYAKISFTVLGDHQKAEIALEGLNQAKGFIRRMIGQRVRMRYTPEPRFVFDQSVEYAARIEQKLEEIKNEDRKNN
ncbi:MAG: 30S ribosome-binding factor RbfA [Candidatus Omnitrophota bacterium]